ncbi:MAG: hypothetical protein HQL14_00605 [Candidatus Omnitrophica bacterium]|nr:hypothetical protein [Candidatus Omnitrophota bacterium]
MSLKESKGKVFMVWMLCILIVLGYGCQQKPQVRQYTEIKIEPRQADSSQADPHTGMNMPAMNPSDPHAGLNMTAMAGVMAATASEKMINWDCPVGWKEEAGSHMRMATFHTTGDPKAIDCYIIALTGPAGGLEANLTRWMGQIGLEASFAQVKQLKQSAQELKTKDGIAVEAFDLSLLQSGAKSSDPSIMAAVIPLNAVTVFVKMTGSIDSVKQNKGNFLKLISSILVNKLK